MQNKYFLLFFILVITGCTTSQAIRSPVTESISVEQARGTKQIDKLVRWGGLVVSVENKSNHSLIEIVERPLTRYGVPKITTKTGGRFLARSDEFIEPENIKPGRYITISGKLINYQVGQIGDYEYDYPLVNIIEYKIWPVNNYRPYHGHHSYYLHDPFWGPYPYYFRHHRHHFRHYY